MSQNGQTHVKKSCSICCKNLKVCLMIFGHYVLKDRGLSHKIFLEMFLKNQGFPTTWLLQCFNNERNSQVKSQSGE